MSTAGALQHGHDCAADGRQPAAKEAEQDRKKRKLGEGAAVVEESRKAGLTYQPGSWRKKKAKTNETGNV